MSLTPVNDFKSSIQKIASKVDAEKLPFMIDNYI
jgi:hypothetical protein